MRFTLLLLILLSSLSVGAQPQQPTPHLSFFGSSVCGDCNDIKEQLLYPLMVEYPNLTIDFIDIDTKEGNNRIIQFDAHFHVATPSPQELFFPDTFLLGFESIMQEGPALIRQFVADSSRWQWDEITTLSGEEVATKRKEIINWGQFWLITGAAIIDGINPCAIATMIFLISFLTTRKKTKNEILFIGISFTLAVFLTYFLLGLGVFRAFTSLQSYHLFSILIKWSAIILAGSVAIISFKDAFSYNKSGKTDTITLQLPKALKIKIHKVISSKLRSGHIIWGAFVTGFLVTLLEAVCTGQVYLPAIAAMTQDSASSLVGALWLAYYCLLFVLPLFMVMIAAYKGLTWERLAKVTQKNLPLLKILLGLIMGALAVYLYILA